MSLYPDVARDDAMDTLLSFSQLNEPYAPEADCQELAKNDCVLKGVDYSANE